jgi:predicted ArsR family transcriptional regulator
MDAPDRPGDALGHPTRARLFSLLADLRRPAGTDELAGLLDLHPNGVRVHLGRLLEDGLLTRERVRGRRGRPRDMWTIAPGGRPPSAYAQLARWLVRVLAPPGRTGGAGGAGKSISARRVEATGRQIGRELAPRGKGSAEEKMRGVLTSLGFQPHLEVAPAGGLAYRLGNCPFCDAVREQPDVVCGLHRGVTRGLLDAIAPEARLVSFVPGEDPTRAGCLIELAGPLTRRDRAGPQPVPPRDR